MPQYDLIFQNATLVTPHGLVKNDVAIAQGKIAAIGVNLDDARAVRDCSGLFILPGAIDMHVHFRDPGAPEKEDFESGSCAAAAGGVTTVIDMPNTDPPTVTREALEDKRARATQKSLVNFGFYMGFTGDNFDEIARAEGIAGVKVYTAHSTGGLFVDNIHLIEKLFELGKFVIVHAEDESIIRANAEKYKDRDDPPVHSLIRTPRAAFEAVRAVLHCAKKCDGRVHITHVSSADEVAEIAKFKGELVSADATPHHLFLTTDAYATQGNLVKVNPPLRSEEHRKALWQALREGTIQAVVSDHAPHTLEDKKESYRAAPAGVPGVETVLPLLLDAVHHGELNLEDVARLTSQRPAELLDLRAKGRLEVGCDADLAIIDMEKRAQVGAHGYFSRAGWSPFAGRMLKGWPVCTVVGGNVVFDCGKIVPGHKGREVVVG